MVLTRSEIMSRIRGKNTRPELLVRSRLRALGHAGYRTHYGKYKVDVAFVGRKVAIFVDGCFWHGCPEHFRMPKTNVDFWRTKIERNRKRAMNANNALKKEGWNVVRVWEHQLGEELDRLLLNILGLK